MTINKFNKLNYLNLIEVKLCKSQILRWAGHVKIMEDNRTLKTWPSEFPSGRGCSRVVRPEDWRRMVRNHLWKRTSLTYIFRIKKLRCPNRVQSRVDVVIGLEEGFARLQFGNVSSSLAEDGLQLVHILAGEGYEGRTLFHKVHEINVPSVVEERHFFISF